MKDKEKSTTKLGAISPDVLKAAQTIAKLKGDDFDQLISSFVTEYVNENLHVLTEKVEEIQQPKRDPVWNDPQAISQSSEAVKVADTVVQGDPTNTERSNHTNGGD